MDDRTLEPLSHATIEVRAAADSSLVGGGISDNRGEFSITLKQHAGECLVTVNYLGYGTERMALRPDGAEHHLKVMMKEDALTLNEVVVNSLTQEEKVQRRASWHTPNTATATTTALPTCAWLCSRRRDIRSR